MDEDKSTMIMIIAMLIGAMIILTGCQTIVDDSKEDVQWKVPDKVIINRNVDVYTICEDNVVCYNIATPYKASGSCFRDEDLVKKYCKVK